MITVPRVRRLGHTVLDTGLDSCLGLFDFDPETADAESIATFAGRSCYLSFNKPNPETAADADYIRRTVHTEQHFSVIEHAGAAFYITGISRSLTHELVRHRIFGYSQLSQRYADSSMMDWVCPIEYLDDQEEQAWNQSLWEEAIDIYEHKVRRTMAKLISDTTMSTQSERSAARKKARQSARSVLPNMCETRLVISGNYRTWLEATTKRYSPHAEPEINRLFGEYLLPHLREFAPTIFEGVSR